MHRNIWINWTIEFGPIISFFISLSILGSTNAGLVFSTGLFTVATCVALIWAYIKDKRIALFPIVSGAFVIAFGIFTVYFGEAYIFIIKDSVYNGFFFVLLLVGLLRGKGLLKNLFGSLFDMSEEGWKVLSFRWMIMFFLLTISNEFIWRLYSQETWVIYKFLATIITTVFGAYQIFLARKHRNSSASPWGMRIADTIHLVE